MEAAQTSRRPGSSLSVANVTHRYGAFVALNDINLNIKGAEFIALLGPSGCGKTTLLRIIAGFYRQTSGNIRFDDEDVDGLPPNRRGVGIVFQNYALFPHISVAENIAYGLKAQGAPKATIAPRVREMLAMVQLERAAHHLPRQLSGGQQQRVALARALAPDPKLLLLDEPFAALDKNLRLDMQIEIKRLQRSYGVTTILVSHDQEEALSMADRIAVMNHGAIEQVGTPNEIYDSPSTLFVNKFVGHCNFLSGEVLEARGPSSLTSVQLRGGQIVNCGNNPALRAGASVVVAVRPEHLRLSSAPTDRSLPAVLKAALPLGPSIVYECELPGGVSVKINQPRDGGGEVSISDTPVFLSLVAPERAILHPNMVL